MGLSFGDGRRERQRRWADDPRRQGPNLLSLNERLRAKLENRKLTDGEKLEIKPENTILSEEDLVTLFDSQQEAPQKRNRKKRKNRKKKKKAEKELKFEENEQQTSMTIGEADIVLSQEESEPAIVEEEVENVIEETPAELLKDSFESVISDLSASPEIDEEVKEKKLPPPLSLEKEEEILSQEEEETKSDDTGSIAGESTNSKEQEGGHLSCGESSTSSRERSTSHEHDEIKEAGSTVSNEEGVSERQEEERSTISPEERGNLTEMILDDEFPWHLCLTEEDNSLPSSFSPRDDTGFTVVRRKEKRTRKRKPSPPRKKKRRGERRRNRDRKSKDKKKDKNIPAQKTTTPIKNSPRNACPIRPVIPTTPKEPTPPPPQTLKKDPTLSTPSIPPGFGNIGNNHIKCHQA